jgi:sec-independent protein translocase protein TatB
MFDFAWTELLVIGVVALLVIKPKDLPKVLRTVGYWVRHARQVASEFQSSLEQMARDAELADVKKEIEEAGRKITADVEKTFDPVEVEKLFNEPPPTSPSPTSPPSASPSPEPSPSIAPPDAPPAVPEPVAAADEPTLPFPEPLPASPPPASADAPALEPAGPPRPHDRV